MIFWHASKAVAANRHPRAICSGTIMVVAVDTRRAVRAENTRPEMEGAHEVSILYFFEGEHEFGVWSF